MTETNFSIKSIDALFKNYDGDEDSNVILGEIKKIVEAEIANPTTKSMYNPKFWCISYDVPVSRKSAYSKLRSSFRKVGVMKTWSQYYIPAAFVDVVEKVILDINSEGPESPIVYDLFGYCEKHEKQIKRSIIECIEDLIKKSRIKLFKKLQEAEEELDNHEKRFGVQSTYIRKAKKELKHTNGIALLFQLTNDLKMAIDAFNNLLELKALDFKAELEESRKIEVENKKIA